MSLRPFMVFEIFIMVVLTICVTSFKNDTQVFIYSTRWPPRCNGGVNCTAHGESVRVAQFDEYIIPQTLGVTKIVTILGELLIDGEVIGQVQKVLTMGFTLSYVSYILGLNEVLVLFMFVIYSFTMSSMVTIHDGLYRLGKGNRNLKIFFQAIDMLIFTSSLVVIISYSLRLYDGGGKVEAYPLVVLLFYTGYAVAVRNIRYYNQYKVFPREAIKILANNGIESDMDDILDRPIYPIVEAANPSLVLTFHFYMRLLDTTLISFLMICHSSQLSSHQYGYNI